MDSMVTQRQQSILEAIIEEYFKRAEPISSQILEEEYDFGIKGAMIRREMQELCDAGYLTQPHTSAGRIPTDKAYRLYVDKILSGEGRRKGGREGSFRLDVDLGEEKDTLRLLALLCKKISLLVSNLTVGYLSDRGIVWKEGWGEILREPEFRNPESLLEFTVMLENMEERLHEMTIPEGITVYIGRENPFVRNPHFSTIFTTLPSLHAPDAGEAILMVAGPVRMHYERTIKTLEAVRSIFLIP